MVFIFKAGYFKINSTKVRKLFYLFSFGEMIYKGGRERKKVLYLKNSTSGNLKLEVFSQLALGR